MAYQGLRQWIAKLEEAGQLKRITAKVDWNLEANAIAREMENQEGPALLFENIKDHEKTICRKLLLNSLGSREGVAMAVGLPIESSDRRIIEFLKGKLGQQMEPIKVPSGPVKQNIVTGDAVDLYEFPVPRYMELDGGRYINTRACIITMDPDTKIMNVGLYRGMIGDNGKSIPVFLARDQHWGIHFRKYEQRGEEMPVAVVYGCDPVIMMYATAPIVHPGCSEYEFAGGLRAEPVELVKCETSDLYVPAGAEIVVEGKISADPKTFQMEGPFGEYPGFYAGLRQPRHTIRVECITHRDDPIFHGGTSGNSPGHLSEDTSWDAYTKSAVIWKYLEDIGVPNIIAVRGNRITGAANLRVQIDKSYRGHAKQVAAAVWSQKSANFGKNLVVVDKDVDIFDDQAVEWAMAYRVNADMGDVQFFSGTIGTTMDPSIPLPQRDVIKYGQGKWTRVFIDATVNWDLEPEEQYGGKRQPPLCTEISPETAELIKRRWSEYGL